MKNGSGGIPPPSPKGEQAKGHSGARVAFYIQGRFFGKGAPITLHALEVLRKSEHENEKSASHNAGSYERRHG